MHNSTTHQKEVILFLIKISLAYLLLSGNNNVRLYFYINNNFGLIFFLVIVPKIKKKELNEKKEKELLLLDIKKKLTIILDKKGTSAIGKNYFGAPIKELEELYRDVAKSYVVNNMNFQ